MDVYSFFFLLSKNKTTPVFAGVAVISIGFPPPALSGSGLAVVGIAGNLPRNRPLSLV